MTIKLLIKIKDKWVERFLNGGSTKVQTSSEDLSMRLAERLPEPETIGWAIPKRAFRR